MAPDVDYTALRFWIVDMGQWATSIAIGAYVWMRTRRKSMEAMIVKAQAASDDSLKAYQEMMDLRCAARMTKIQKIDDTAQQLRIDLAHMPSHKDIKDLSSRIDLLHGGIKELSGRLTGINRAVDLMNEFLIQQGGKP